VTMIVYGCKKVVDNSAPSIQSITSYPITSNSIRLRAGDHVTISVTATDPNKDNLLYSWEADGGSFVGETNRASIIWESPVVLSEETYEITANVTDGEATSSKDISIYVNGVYLCNLNGYVYYAGTTIPVTGVQISVNKSSATTDDEGYYEINDIPAGNQILTGTKEGFDTFSTSLEFLGGTKDLNLEMTSATYTHNLFGNITSKSNGAGIPNCRVAVINPDGTESQLFTYTSSSGYYQIPTVPQGNRNLKITEKCYFKTQVLIANSDYQYNAEFETEVTDPRDGRTYTVVEIGGKVWMAENLNYGDRIDGSEEQTDNQIVEKYCYNNNEHNCNIYGGLYQWMEMLQYDNTQGTQGICMDGWHLPTENEWTALAEYLGGIKIAGSKLKEAGTIHWEAPNRGATNESGFSALPGGDRNYFGSFDNEGESGKFWSSTEFNNLYASGWQLYYLDLDLSYVYDGKENGRSVRCVRD